MRGIIPPAYQIAAFIHIMVSVTPCPKKIQKSETADISETNSKRKPCTGQNLFAISKKYLIPNS
jgi:hypothetical protein